MNIQKQEQFVGFWKIQVKRALTQILQLKIPPRMHVSSFLLSAFNFHEFIVVKIKNIIHVF